MSTFEFTTLTPADTTTEPSHSITLDEARAELRDLLADAALPVEDLHELDPTEWTNPSSLPGILAEFQVTYGPDDDGRRETDRWAILQVDEPRPVGSATAQDVRSWLGPADATGEQVDQIRTAWDALDALHAEWDPDDPDREESSTGAAMMVLGDATLESLGQETRDTQARLDERRGSRLAVLAAQARLQGAMVVADQQGMSPTEIARRSGVARSTVLRRLGR